MEAAATRVLRAVAAGLAAVEEQGRSVDDFLDSAPTAPKLRRTVSNILFSHFRHRVRIERELRRLIAKPPKSALRRLLMAAATQIFYCDGIAPESAVNVAVDLIRREAGMHAAGFANAVLRRLRALPPENAAERRPDQVLPPALLAHWQKRLEPAELNRLTEIFLTPADNTFRCRRDNPLTPEEAEKLQAEALPPAVADTPWCFYRTASPTAVLNDPDWRAGRFYFQDPATVGAVALPDFHGVRRVLDLCAAPGGKSLLMAECLEPGAQLVAVDRSARRQQLTRENFLRCGLADVPVVVAEPWDLAVEYGDFDLVLADVPCSNTGVFRRRPDVLWRFRPETLPQLSELQNRILEAAAGRTGAGGQLLYSTCSIEPAENEALTAAFQARHPEFRIVAECRLSPDRQHDGAYACLLRRSDTSI